MADKVYKARDGALVDQADAGGDITVTSANSPYNIPGPTADYNSITIKSSGNLMHRVQTRLTVNTLTKE